MLAFLYLFALTPIYLWLFRDNLKIVPAFWKATISVPERLLLSPSCGIYESGLKLSTSSRTINLRLPPSITVLVNDPNGQDFDTFGFLLLISVLMAALFVVARWHFNRQFLPTSFLTYDITPLLRIAAANGFAWLHLHAQLQLKQVPSYLALIRGRGLAFINSLVVASRAVKTQYQNLAQVTKRLVGGIGELIKVADRLVGVIGEVIGFAFRLSKRLVGGLVHFYWYPDECVGFAFCQLWTLTSKAGAQLRQDPLTMLCAQFAGLKITHEWWHFRYLDMLTYVWTEPAKLQPHDSLASRVPAGTLPVSQRLVVLPWYEPIPRVVSMGSRPMPKLSFFGGIEKAEVIPVLPPRLVSTYDPADNSPSKPPRSSSLSSVFPAKRSTKRMYRLLTRAPKRRFFRFASSPLPARRRRPRSPVVEHLETTPLPEEPSTPQLATILPPEPAMASSPSPAQPEYTQPTAEEMAQAIAELNATDLPSAPPSEADSDSKSYLDESVPASAEQPVADSPSLLPTEMAVVSSESLEQVEPAPQPEEWVAQRPEIAAGTSQSVAEASSETPVQPGSVQVEDGEVDLLAARFAQTIILDDDKEDDAVEMGDCESPVDAPVDVDTPMEVGPPLEQTTPPVESQDSKDVDMACPEESDFFICGPSWTPLDPNLQIEFCEPLTRAQLDALGKRARRRRNRTMRLFSLGVYHMQS